MLTKQSEMGFVSVDVYRHTNAPSRDRIEVKGLSYVLHHECIVMYVRISAIADAKSNAKSKFTRHYVANVPLYLFK